MTAEDALREIARIIQDGSRPTRRLDRIYRVCVQSGAIRVESVDLSKHTDSPRGPR